MNDPKDVLIIENILKELGCPVLQSYGTADLGLVAYETWDDDGMFCDEGVFLEIVRNKNSIKTNKIKNNLGISS